MSVTVVIIGGGVAGLAAALSLHQIGLHPTVYETNASSGDATVGAAVGLAPNGLSSLAIVSKDAADRVYSSGYKCATFEMRDADGSYLGLFPAGREGRYGEYGSIMVRRSDAQQALIREVEKAGIRVLYAKRLVEVKDLDDGVHVKFEDGYEDQADVLIGADGVRSVVRSYIAPENQLFYSGLVGVGGFIPKSSFEASFREKLFPYSSRADKTKGTIMVFGPLGFFGFAPVDHKLPEEGGSWIWWSTFEADEKHVQDWKKFNREEAMEKVRKRHESWGSSVSDIIAKAQPDFVLPNYDLESLDRWCTKRIVLIGDAAHVMPPHSGQGMSQAFEDAVCLALSLRKHVKLTDGTWSKDRLPVEKAFGEYVEARKPRVDKILEIARRNGDDKREKTVWQCFIRKWFMRIFLAICPESMFDWQYRCPYEPGCLTG